MIWRVCLCLLMTVIGGPPRAFGSLNKAMILQSLLPNEFPHWKVGEFGGWGRILSVEGMTGTLHRLPSGFSPFPWCQRWFLLRVLRFFLHQIPRGSLNGLSSVYSVISVVMHLFTRSLVHILCMLWYFVFFLLF